MGSSIKLRMPAARNVPNPWKRENSMQIKRIKKEDAMALAISPMLMAAPSAMMITQRALIIAHTQREKMLLLFFLFMT